MKKILNVLKNDQAYKSLINSKNNIVTNSTIAQALLISSAFFELDKDLVIVKPTLKEANDLYNILKSVSDDVHLFSCDESFRVEALTSSPELLIQRIKTLYHITSKRKKILIVHTHSLIRYLPSPTLFNKSIIELKTGDVVDINELTNQLVNIGYNNISIVNQPFYFCKRGGVIDIYSVQYEYPIRIEFFDDEIDYIKFYNPKSQRTIEKIEEVQIIPASDILYESIGLEDAFDKMDKLLLQASTKLEKSIYEELENKVSLDKELLNEGSKESSMYTYYSLFNNTSNILNYLNDPLIIVSDKKMCDEAYKRFISENFFYNTEMYNLGKFLKGLDLFYELDDVLKDDYKEFVEFGNEKDILFNTHDLVFNHDKEDIVIKQINDYLKQNDILICLKDKHQITLICDLLDKYEYTYHSISLSDKIEKGINIYLGSIPRGIELIDEKIIVLTDYELFGKVSIKKPKHIRYKGAKTIHDTDELNVGDYVVHDQYGIGQYLGIKTLEVKGFHKDYLYIAYKGDDTLYIPVEQFKLIRKYSSKEGITPKIYALDGKKWKKDRAKAVAKIDDIADELIEIYSKRMASVGFEFSPDTSLQIEFENKFEYDLTDDQLQSINEIKADMEKPQPMDRLLCGDVGFGKTEVALRAAFKAICDNKQVAFLCPTTILSMQHYRVVKERFKDFPVEIALLNRFTTTKQKNKILKGLEDGSIDFIIGTHRILSKDIIFKDIGLLIIDEEQRFGVAQKEKIKEYRENIDVISLSATPIPRTLQMSLMGIRGLSQIETPPKDRLPVQTYVIEKNNVLLKQVIERELARGGQVFYLHNKTDQLVNIGYNIQRMVPDAKIAIAHGQMDKDDIEDVMQDFVEGKYNVLVCTTIIETGIDIPNANTMIVDQADHFGLSQLYQIRGRVGRSDKIAYAYFMYNPKKSMTEEATKRLKALKEFTELGSGYKIALRDLSIRGGGDILGGKQAGFIETVGFDSYMAILEEAITKRTGKHLVEKKKEIPTTNINVDGYIPKDYIDSDYDKLVLYQRLESVNNLDELADLESEFKDFYGRLPEEVENLLGKRELDILADNKLFENIIDQGEYLVIIFTKEASAYVEGDILFEQTNKYFSKPKFAYLENQISLTLNKEENWLKKLNKLLMELE
ncbi:MAG: transcription-repair coupling factor [Thomasclavelia sp.]|nr:transcription-repair coupling factor [Thomasclavelia sp.]